MNHNNHIELNHSLRLIRMHYTSNFKLNFIFLIHAIEQDAINYVGKDPALLIIKENKSGNRLTQEERSEFLRNYFISVRNAKVLIINKIHHLIPKNVVNCRLFKNYIGAR